ncbi:hypothetical protein DFQ26_006682 [Actinomortierella ambigua]|nr:hypothetical protein DFQ26_006682 [Actinomortierella ambigua]
MDSDIFQHLGSNPETSRNIPLARNPSSGGPLRVLGFRKKDKTLANGGAGAGGTTGNHNSGHPSAIRLSPNDTHAQKPTARNTPMLSFQLHHTEMSTDRPSVSGRLLLHIPRLHGKKFHFVSLALHLRLKEAIAWTRQDLVTFEIERQSWSQTVWDKKMVLPFQDKQVEEGPDGYMTCRVREPLASDGLASIGIGSSSGGAAAAAVAAGATTAGSSRQRARDATVDIAADEWRWEWLMPVTRQEVRPESFEGSMGTLWYELEAKCLFRWDEVDEQGRVKETLFPSTQAVDAILDARSGKVDSTQKDRYSGDDKSGKGKAKSLAKVFSKLRVRNKSNHRKPTMAGDFNIGPSPIVSALNLPATDATSSSHPHHPHHPPYSTISTTLGGSSGGSGNKVEPERKGPPEPLPFLIRKLVKLYFVKPPPRSSSSNPAGFFLPPPSMALPNLPGTRRLKAIIPGARIQVQIQIPSVIPVPGYDLTSNLVPSHKKGGGFLVPATDRHHQHHYHHHPITGPAAAAAAAAAAAVATATTTPSTATTGRPVAPKEKERQALRERSLSQFPGDFQVALTIRKVTHQDIQRNDILRRRYESTSVRPRSMVDIHGQHHQYYNSQINNNPADAVSRGEENDWEQRQRVHSQQSQSSTATLDTTASPPWATAESTRSMDPLLARESGCNQSNLSSISSPPPISTSRHVAPASPPRAWRKEIRVRRVKCEFWQKESCRIPMDNAPSRTIKVALGQPFIYSEKDQNSKAKLARQRQNSAAVVTTSNANRTYSHDPAITAAEQEQLLSSPSPAALARSLSLPVTSGPTFNQHQHSSQNSLTAANASLNKSTQAFMLLIPIPLDSPKLRQTFSWPTTELLAQVTQAMIAAQQQQLQQQQQHEPLAGFAGAGGPIVPARPVAIDGHFFVNDRRHNQSGTDVIHSGTYGYTSAGGAGDSFSNSGGGNGSEFDFFGGGGEGGEAMEMQSLGNNRSNNNLSSDAVDANNELILADWQSATSPTAAMVAAEVAAAATAATGVINPSSSSAGAMSATPKLPHVKARIEVKHYLSFRLSIDMLEYEGEPEDEEQDLELAEEQQLQQVKERQEVSAAVLSPGSRTSFYEQIELRHHQLQQQMAIAAAAATVNTRGEEAEEEDDDDDGVPPVPPLPASILLQQDGDAFRIPARTSSLIQLHNTSGGSGTSQGSSTSHGSNSVSIISDGSSGGNNNINSHSGTSTGGWSPQQRKGSKSSLGMMMLMGGNGVDDMDPQGYPPATLGKPGLLKKTSNTPLNTTAVINTSTGSNNNINNNNNNSNSSSSSNSIKAAGGTTTTTATGRVNVHKLKDFVIRVPVTVVIQSSRELAAANTSAESGPHMGRLSVGEDLLGEPLMHSNFNISSGSKVTTATAAGFYSSSSSGGGGGGGGDPLGATTAVGIVGDRIEVIPVSSTTMDQAHYHGQGAATTSNTSTAKRLQELYQMQQQQHSPHTLLSPLDLLTLHDGLGGGRGGGPMLEDELEYEIGEEREDDEEQGVVITRGAIGL